MEKNKRKNIIIIIASVSIMLIIGLIIVFACNDNATDKQSNTQSAVTVRFKTGSKTAIPSQTIKSGACATVPNEIPEKDGYEFIGWDFDFTTSITANTVISAVWEEIPVKLSLKSDDTYEVVGPRYYDATSIVIKSSYHGIHVTRIRDIAFYRCSSLESITLPASITSIGSGAFSNCSSLESITLPASITSIGDGAFSNCNSLKSITLPASITSIEDYAFFNCNSLKSITLPASITSIGDYAFYRCSSLESITLPASITSIGDEAFYRCSSLESITLPASITSIGKYAFMTCGALESITIPAALEYIGTAAFSGCDNLTSATFVNPNGWSAGTTPISSTDLSDASTAATYLKTTYLFSIWTRT